MGRAVSFIASLTVLISTSASAQTNSWISPTSGKWEDASSWSLGAPPSAGQTILLANHGWKAVAIDNYTAANSPQTMSIDSLSVTSPGTDTVNTVLLNFAGLQTPLSLAHDLYVSNDTAMVILQSALQLTNGTLEIDGGTVTEDNSSQVSAANLQLTNGGIYNLTNSTLTVPVYNSAETIAPGSLFNQAGGSNYCFGLYDYGEYDLFDGHVLAPGFELAGGLQALNGTFIQYGGTVGGSIVVGKFGGWGGTYELLGGVLATSSLLIPQGPPSGNPGGPCIFFQGGGTNVVGYLSVAGIDGGIIETTVGTSSYTLTNGLLVSTNLAIGGMGSFSQSGGVHTNQSMDLSESVIFERQQPGEYSYFVTNYGYYTLSGGTFASGVVNAQPGNFNQSAGTCQITALQMGGGTYTLAGGTLAVSTMTLSNANFLQTAGTVTQTGTLTLANANLTAGPGPQQFGGLQLNASSTLALPRGNSTVYFANSSGLPWSSAALLIISGWNGSLAGSGSQQIYFGNGSAGLTSQQSSQVQFIDPAGLARGVYVAKILSSGEVVPDAGQVVSLDPETVNSWNSQTGGNWDDASSWSLGIVPSSSQSVFFTNDFWKAITIDSSTLANAPGSLTVSNLTMGGAPSGVETTRNTLLLNYVGAGNPLTIGVNTNTPGSLIVGTNSFLTMFSSGLIVNNLLGPTNQHLGEFEVDGSLSQSDGSEVVANFLDVSDTGTYSMTNGTLYIGNQFINGTFDHDGGLNLGTVDLESTNSDYELVDGTVRGNVIVRAGTFNQSGGTNSATLVTGYRGLYNLKGGVLMPGDLVVGAPARNYLEFPGGMIQQTGGTNIAGNITITNGFYVLDNGTVQAASLTISTNAALGNLDVGEFDQYGGYHTNGAITLYGGTNDYRGQISRVAAKYNLNPGMLQTPLLTMYVGDFGQSGGTNKVGTLAMNASIYAMGGGLLQADQIQLTAGSQFWHMAGNLGGSLNVTMATGDWAESTTGAQLGQLQLASGYSFLGLPSAKSCVFKFADSSAVSWAGDGILMIQWWNGSLSGGGAHQVFFGTTGSGLTAQQLTQVQFSNPAGLPDGIYAARILSNGEIVPDASSSTTGAVNSWINPASGNWGDASSWSLGILPNSSQSILIGNAGSKSVSINSSTPVNFAGSMTVSDLFISASTNTANTLVLNNFGTNVPLTVVNSLTLQNNGRIQNFNSGLVVQDGTFMITNSIMTQNGGFVRATNQVYLSGSEYDLTNGDFEAGTVWLGNPVTSHINQYGGSVSIASLVTESPVVSTNLEGYSLYGGRLNLPAGMFLFGEAGGLQYSQSGGTNLTGDITIEAGYGGIEPGFQFDGGLLADRSMSLIAGPIGDLTVSQNGGSHVITNGLYLAGGNDHGEYEAPATYFLNNGTLSAGTIELAGDEGDSHFVESNGVASAGTVYAHSQGYYSANNTYITLAGGSLSCSNFTVDDGGHQFNQAGGNLIVSNLLSLSGSRSFGITIYAQYSFTGGTISASNINIAANWSIGDGTSNRISNPGTFTLSHSLTINNALEQLGHFVLAGTNATINLAGSSSQLSFANSSSEAWAPGATLLITNWNGNPVGGGAEQLKFGTDQTGLTADQLSQIEFQIGTNSYAAKILTTGEVVPNQAVAPSVAVSHQGNSLIMSWPAGAYLQTATNAFGPYFDVTNATSPYTNDMTRDPQRFFRLRQ